MHKLFLFILMLCATLSAAVYYISPSGSDAASNSGSISQPWKTIAGALFRARGGDTIWAMDGHYPSLRSFSGPPVPFASMVYVIAQHTRQATIDAQSGKCVGFYVANCKNISLEGFVMDAANAPDVENVCHLGGGSYLMIKNCTITHGAGGHDNADALKINANVHHVLIEGNIIFDGTDEEIDVVETNGLTHDIVFRKNLIYQRDVVKDEAMLSFKGGNDGNGHKGMVRRCIVDGNVFGTMNTGSSNGALRFGGCENPGEEAEVLVGINNAFINSYGREGAFSLGGSKRTLFANNVVYNTGGGSCLVGIYSNYSTANENAYFKIVNNIFYSTTASFPGSVYKLTNINASSVHDYQMDYNLYYNGGSAIPTAGLFNPNGEPHKVLAKPLFEGNGTAVTGASAYDWIDKVKILAGSPSINKGVDLATLNLDPAVDSLLQDYFYGRYDSWYNLIKTDGYRDAFGNPHGAGLAMDMGLSSSDAAARALPGTHNHAGGAVIEISPNPVVGHASIILTNIPGRVMLSVFDINGKRVGLINPLTTKAGFVWNTAGVANGVYILTVSGGEAVYSKRLILQK